MTVGLVLGILPLRNDAEIAPPIVKAVLRDVVAFEPVSWNQAEDLAMEPDDFSSAAFASSSDRIAIRQTPCPPAGPIGVCRVDGGVGANAAIAVTKRNLGSAISRDERRRTITTARGIARLPAIDPLTDAQLVTTGEEVAAALMADTRDGTIVGHRRVPSGGVARRGVSSTAGAFAYLNFTMSGVGVA